MKRIEKKGFNDYLKKNSLKWKKGDINNTDNSNVLINNIMTKMKKKKEKMIWKRLWIRIKIIKMNKYIKLQ